MTIRWGFLGAGYVASRAMAPAVHLATGAQLQGVASRDPGRSKALEPVAVFASYEHLIESPDIDAVYISLTNSQHVHWVIAALNAGKHVLCEKPLAMNAGEVELMHRAAVEANRSVVEAMWVRWHPRHRRFTELLRSGELGESVHLRSAFTFTSDMTDNYRLSPEMGGGALLDVGCYQVHTWLAAFGSHADLRVVDVEQTVGPTGVDLATRVRVIIDEHVTATMVCSFIDDPRQELVAEGSKTTVEMLDGEAFTSWREPSSLRIGDVVERFDAVDAFVSMTEQVSRQFAGDEPALFDPEESFGVARIIDEVARAVQS
ncbi:MAG: Gfo/Idh/MocA family protein [Actinomycetota bacterium]